MGSDHKKWKRCDFNYVALIYDRLNRGTIDHTCRLRHVTQRYKWRRSHRQPTNFLSADVDVRVSSVLVRLSSWFLGEVGFIFWVRFTYFFVGVRSSSYFVWGCLHFCVRSPSFFVWGCFCILGEVVYSCKVVLTFCVSSFSYYGKVVFIFWVRSSSFFAYGQGHLHSYGEVIFIYLVKSSLYFVWDCFLFFGWDSLNFLVEFVFMFLWGCLHFWCEVVFVFWVRLTRSNRQ